MLHTVFSGIYSSRLFSELFVPNEKTFPPQMREGWEVMKLVLIGPIFDQMFDLTLQFRNALANTDIETCAVICFMSPTCTHFNLMPPMIGTGPVKCVLVYS